MLITHISEDIADFFIEHSNELQDSGRNQSTDYVALTSSSVWWSGNLVDLLDSPSHNFTKSCFYLKTIAEKLYHTRLYFHYLHYLNYENGGAMGFHSHEHNEDCVFLLYLNDCMDGETNFNVNNRFVSVMPKKSQVVFFESDIEHGASYSTSKKVLVGGMRKLR